MMRRMWRSLRAAVSFLTVLPVGGEDDAAVLAESVFWYPWVGLFIGGITALAAATLRGIFPHPLVALLAVLLATLITGGFHLDGLADTADGFFSARSRERMLAIMRDSRIGVMGVLALLFVLGIKTVALAVMPPGRMAAALLLMPLAGRSAILLLLWRLPYARPEGCASAFFRKKQSAAIALACALLLLCLAAAVAGGGAMAAVFAALALVLLFARQCRNRIGGATGDTLGAASELAEVAVALVMAAAISS
ncbi:MAG: adenosylcobinamide-GDP ribazoletransferase [Thermodesulfobacteriota bacterium]